MGVGIPGIALGSAGRAVDGYAMVADLGLSPETPPSRSAWWPASNAREGPSAVRDRAARGRHRRRGTDRRAWGGAPGGYDPAARGLAANGYGDHSPGHYSMTAGLIAEMVLTFFFPW